MLQFILERYNYWIVIVLMMTGLYIVFSRGNLVKKIIGLNIFQTSVFIFYITIGKVAGGTAPIFVSGHGEGIHSTGGHGDGGHGEGEHDGHGESGHSEGASSSDHASSEHGGVLHGGEEEGGAQSLHSIDGVTDGGGDKIGNPFADISNKDFSQITGDHNDAHINDETFADAQIGNDNLHSLPDVDSADIADKISNSVFADAKAGLSLNGGMELELETGTTELAHSMLDKSMLDKSIADDLAAKQELTATGGDALGTDALGSIDLAHHSDGVAQTIYSNPLPHVLILTAIVVGVATTAVGLALAVRIREAYGTIEEDELEAADDIAEFGSEGSYESAPELASGYISEKGGAK